MKKMKKMKEMKEMKEIKEIKEGYIDKLGFFIEGSRDEKEKEYLNNSIWFSELRCLECGCRMHLDLEYLISWCSGEKCGSGEKIAEEFKNEQVKKVVLELHRERENKQDRIIFLREEVRELIRQSEILKNTVIKYEIGNTRGFRTIRSILEDD